MWRWTLFILVVCGLAVAAIEVDAAPPVHSPTASAPMNLEQAVRQVQHETRGRVLAADTISRGRSNIYRIKVLTPQGKIKVMQLHSKTRPQADPRTPRTDGGGH